MGFRSRKQRGDTMVEATKAAHLDASQLEWIDSRRADGVTDDDIRRWWNLSDATQEQMNDGQNVATTAVWVHLVEEGLTSEDAAYRSVRTVPLFGPESTWEDAHLEGDDRPLPYELWGRVDDWIRDNYLGDPAQLDFADRGYSSANAMIRAEIRAGRL